VAEPDRQALLAAVTGELSQAMSTRTVLLHAAVAERLGLHITDHKCLSLILRAGGRVTAGQLADLSGLTTGAVTGVVDRLERAGFVRRIPDPHDRRRVLVQVARDRLEPINAIFAPMKAAMEELAASYSDQELAVLADFMRRAGDVVERRVVELRSGADRVRAPRAARSASWSRDRARSRP
jgi:DNA-binding MarR family transcriptional regulator